MFSFSKQHTKIIILKFFSLEQIHHLLLVENHLLFAQSRIVHSFSTFKTVKTKNTILNKIVCDVTLSILSCWKILQINRSIKGLRDRLLRNTGLIRIRLMIPSIQLPCTIVDSNVYSLVYGWHLREGALLNYQLMSG